MSPELAGWGGWVLVMGTGLVLLLAITLLLFRALRRAQEATAAMAAARDESRRTAQLIAQRADWTALSQSLGLALQRAQDETSFGRSLLRILGPYLGARAGTVHRWDGVQFVPLSIYGQGVATRWTGAFASEDAAWGPQDPASALQVHTPLPQDYMQTGEAWDLASMSLLVLPLQSEQGLKGLVTLALDRAPAVSMLNLLPELMPVLVLNLDMLRQKAYALREYTERAATEERLRLILGSVTEGIFGLDLQGQVSFINDAGARMLGYREDDIIGRVAHALFHHSRPGGGTFPPESSAMRQTLADGTPRQVSDEVFWRADHRPMAVEYTTMPMQSHGRIVGAVVSFRDISERLQRERELAQVLDEQAALLDGAPLGVMFAGDGQILRVNTAMAQIFGFSEPAAMLGRQTAEIFESAPSYQDFGLQVGPPLSQGEAVQRLWPVKRQNGQVFMGRISGKGLSRPLANYRHATVWMIEDVSDSVALQHKLQARERQLTVLLDSLADVVVVADREGLIYQANRQVEHLLGYTANELEGQAFATLCPPELRQGLDLERERFFQTLSPQVYGSHGRFRVVAKDGRLVPVELSISPMTLDGRLMAVAVMRDISERLASQHAMAELIHEQAALFEGAPIGILFAGDSTVLRANPEVARQLGLAHPRQMVGWRTSHLYASDEDFAAFGARVGPTLARGEVVQLQWTLRRVDGHLFAARLTGKSLMLTDGRYTHANVWMIEELPTSGD